MNKIDIRFDKNVPPLDRAWLRKALRLILSAAGFSGRELSVYICDEESMRELNRRWRGKNRVTDVLSFPQSEGADVQDPCLGDLVICGERAREQAELGGRDLYSEMRALLIHGVVHLAGFDHERDRASARAMRNEEERIRGKVEESLAGKA